MTYFQDKDGTPLCEKPEWGQGWSRCQHIGVGAYTDDPKDWVCVRYRTVIRETSDGWLARCEACAQGNYIPRSPECIHKPKPCPVLRKPKKTKALKYSDIKDIPISAPIIEVFRVCLRLAIRPVTKTELLSFISGRYREGYISSRFVSAVNEVNRVFDSMVESGEIVYEKGKPLIWRDR